MNLSRTFIAITVVVYVHGLAPSSSRWGSGSNRRAFFKTAGAVLGAGAIQQPAMAAQEKEYRQGIEVNAFNGLIFNYRGGDFNGLDANSLNEESISYAEFNEKLKGSEVAFVEFLAPDGDVAYATFKDNKRLRIGEGYPIEQHDGYSSPMFCVRAVKNAGVPYKFVVPALMKS
eukprot:CAMPEP_0178873182 /NCGR_PEP_ID=MMETSP0747-20121128/8530_1 /TAXON_ID=913974 /ORGANISM="Nitzschia punctata, Strain CCMP561" /LENGTH=172 /DNA_ID=CAMNT_0020540465 /DNA_START=28 /DNA_END=546 /DNA_ORIENTATION=-